MAKRSTSAPGNGLISKLRLRSEEDRRRLSESDPRAAEALGVKPKASANKKRAPKKKTTHRVGPLLFDSKTEAEVYSQLTNQFVAVIAHGKIALGDDTSFSPDFIEVLEVREDGNFVGRLSDAKAIWRGKKTPHIEKDWKLRAKWLKDKTGMIVRIVTKGGPNE